MAEQRTRLDQPRVEHGLRRPRINTEAFGEWSERIARYFGTARYLAIQTIFVAVWIAINVVWGINYHNSHHHGTKPFDPYPFILLNLAFSTQAAYAAPLILLAQNRQADRDRVQGEADREEARQAKADVEYLARELAAIRLSLGEVATRDFLRAELARVEAARETHEPEEA
ncbi:MAG TPA: DUF1003 domain-containing protein [Jatrophihabitans sp.]|nr:DUF1003 domain-containing protein [Jatrophihabitans sp.]